MSIALATKVLDLEKRVAALERSGGASPRCMTALYAQAAAMRIRGDALRAEVRVILEAHKGPRPLKAYAVLTMLKREPLPSLRRIQQVLQELKRSALGVSSSAEKY